MNKARNIIIATAGAVLLMGTVLVASAAIRAGGGITPTVFADGEQKSLTSITLDRNNAPTITDGSGTLQYNQYASFAYTEASALANGHVALGAGGTIVKNEESNELTSFTVNFTGGLTLTTGYENSDDVCYSYVLESGTPQTVHGNYFKLKADEETNITSIQINFGCLEEETELHTWSDEWSHDADYHWHACEDLNCVKVDSKAAHDPEATAQVDPTETQTGLTAGTICSVCGRTLSGREVLPVLDKEGINYEFENRTTKVDDVVADFEQYTWKEDDSVVIYANPGEPLTEYIHAGSSYYSIETWNDMFENQEAAVSGTGDSRTLTITLNGDTTVLAEDRVSDLDGTFDLTLYKNVIIDGSGTLNIAYTENQDGIKCHNLTIGENVTLNLSGNDATVMTGVSFAGKLQIDGTYQVTNFGNGIGINTDINASATDNILVNGALRITNCKDGIHAWTTPSGGASINVNGVLLMENIRDQGMDLASAVTINFNAGCEANIAAGINAILRNSSGVINFEGGEVNLTATGKSSDSTAIGSLTNVALETNNAASINFNDGIVNITSGDIGIKTSADMGFVFDNDVVVNITADKVGIYAALGNDSDKSKMTMNQSSKLTIVSENGTGIYCNNVGTFTILDNSKLDITAASSGIYNFKQFRAYNGGKTATTMNTASVIIKTYGVTGTTGWKTSTVYGIHAREDSDHKFTDIGFRTTGKVLIENLGTQSGVGFHAGLPSSGNGNIVIAGCTDFTIKNFSTAMSVNSGSTGMNTKTYNYDNNAKIKVRGCATPSSGASWFTNIFKSASLDIQ